MKETQLNDGYSIVNKPKKHLDPGYEELNNIEEPNYESMPSESDNYARVQKSESESDPNYESVKYLDVALSEPPYERLNEKESDASEYEQVSSKSHSTPDYERIKEHGSKSSDNSEDRTISDNSKFSNGTDEEDNKKGINDKLSAHSSVEVDVNVVDVDEIIVNNDEHMYFQV